MPINYNANILVRGPGTFETLTYEILENPNTGGGTVTSQTDKDTNVTLTTSTGVDNNFIVVTNAKIINLTPTIVDVNAISKSVTKKLNGVCQLRLEDGLSKVLYQRNMTTAGAVSTRNVTSFATGSLRKHITDNMIAALNGVTRGAAKQSSSIWNGTTDVFNTGLFLVGNKTGYTAPASDILQQALWAGNYGDNNSKVWITPYHYLNFKYHNAPSGSTWRQINGEIIVNYSATQWTGTLAKRSGLIYRIGACFSRCVIKILRLRQMKRMCCWPCRPKTVSASINWSRRLRQQQRHRFWP